MSEDEEIEEIDLDEEFEIDEEEEIDIDDDEEGEIEVDEEDEIDVEEDEIDDEDEIEVDEEDEVDIDEEDDIEVDDEDEDGSKELETDEIESSDIDGLDALEDSVEDKSKPLESSLYSCEICGNNLPKLDVDLGNIKKIDGMYVCTSCLPDVEDVLAQPVARTTSRSRMTDEEKKEKRQEEAIAQRKKDKLILGAVVGAPVLGILIVGLIILCQRGYICAVAEKPIPKESFENKTSGWKKTADSARSKGDKYNSKFYNSSGTDERDYWGKKALAYYAIARYYYFAYEGVVNQTSTSPVVKKSLGKQIIISEEVWNEKLKKLFQDGLDSEASVRVIYNELKAADDDTTVNIDAFCMRIEKAADESAQVWDTFKTELESVLEAMQEEGKIEDSEAFITEALDTIIVKMNGKMAGLSKMIVEDD